MGLSDDEQRILEQMEQSLSDDDPEFVERVRTETVYRYAGRYCLWAAVGFMAALIFMLCTFANSIILGFVGVVLMFAAGLVFVNNARRLGRAGLEDLTRNLQHRRRPAPVDPRDWVRDQFRRRQY